MDTVTNESNNRINKALMMSEKEYIKSQQSIIDDFFKEYYTYDVSNIGYWIVAGLFTFIQLVFCCIPMQKICKEGKLSFINASDDKEFLIIMAVLIAFPVYFYLQPFVVGNLNGRVGSIYSRIKHLPVSLKAVRLYRFKKMVRFVLKVFGACVVLQLSFSLLIYHGINWGTVVFLVIYGFLIPFVVGICAATGFGELYFTK